MNRAPSAALCLPHPKMGRNQRGSALFLILIGVAIFAALSYAVVEGLRVSEGTTNAVNQDKGQLEATSVLDFTYAVRSAVQQMRVDGVPAANLDFVIPGDEPAFSTAPHTSKVFHPQGGHASYTAVWPALDDPTQATPTAWNFLSNAVDGIGGSGNEVILTLIAVPERTCSELDRILIGTTTIPSVSGDINGMFSTGSTPMTAVNCAACEGKAGACVENGGLRAFYFVLDRG